jgi:DNA-binding NarL/FixJ family response regulator
MKKRSVMKKIKVLLIEDNRLLRDGTTAMLNEQKDILVESSAGNRSALDKAMKFLPNVVLLDIGLKSDNSLRVLESIKKKYPRTEVIVMDLIPTHSEVSDFVKAGISGFISKDASLDDFLRTIRSVIKGIKIMPPTIADSVFSQIVDHAIQGGTVNRVIGAIKLTKREQEVIALLANGKSITEVSHKLKIAVFTVKSHVRNILDKLALHTRLELASFTQTKALRNIAPVRER